MSQSDKLTKKDIKKLTDAACLNQSGDKSDLLTVLDHTHAMLMGWVAKDKQYSYIQHGEKSREAVEALWIEMEQVFRPLRAPALHALPIREAFRETFAKAFHLFKPDDPDGKFYREAINQAFEVLELEPVRDVESAKDKPRGRRPHR